MGPPSRDFCGAPSGRALPNTFESTHSTGVNSMATNVIHAADFSSPYAGNFMASLRALGEACAGQGGRMVLVLPPSAAERPWCEQAMAAGQAVRFVSPTAPLLRRAAALASDHSVRVEPRGPRETRDLALAFNLVFHRP